MMNRTKRLLSVTLLTLLCGCASSERMGRMSGGVFGSYGEPKAHRIRSEKYRKIADYGHGRDENKHRVTPTVVNLWPFFFRSDAYFSILWPFADFDPYGMAIRPFYNHEGDDYSILFPYCSWNTADGTGWAIPAWWRKGKFVFFPLISHETKDNWKHLYYTPFFIHEWKKNTPDWNYLPIEESFTELLLGYGSKKIFYDIEKAPALKAYRYHKNKARFLAELKYRGIPEIQGEINWKKEQEKLPLYALRYAGFFPLFHYFQSPEKKSLRLLLFLYGEEKKHSCDYSFFGKLIGEYTRSEQQPFDLRYYWGWGRSFSAWLLLSHFERTSRHAESGIVKAARELYRSCLNADIKSAYIKGKLAQIDPQLKLPETVTDGYTLQLFLQDYMKQKKNLPVETTCKGGFLPLFLYKFTKDSSWWCSPVLLSTYDKTEKKSFWGSIPLLSGGSKSAEEENCMIAGPVYVSQTVRIPEKTAQYSAKKIHSRDTKWAEKSEQLEYTDQYLLFWLLYRGRDLFFVEKEGLPSGAAEHLREAMRSARTKTAVVKKTEKRLADRERAAKARKTGNDKIAYYEQQIEFERIRREREKLNAEKSKQQELLKEAQTRAQRLNFALPENFSDSDQALNEAVAALFAQCAERREYRDYGGGIFFRKELFYNGDYKWHWIGLLAGGEKRGDYEKTHILQLLYRHIRQGNTEETLCFPFIFSRKSGEDTQFSFMWRLLNIEKKQGKSGGHILFIPYGFRWKE